MHFLSRFKSVLKRLIPNVLHPPKVAEWVLERMKLDPKIRSGPFCGVLYSWEPWDKSFSSPTPKMLGTYERELFPLLREILEENDWMTIVDVGAADGYYAVGLAVKLPMTEVVAFEELADGTRRMMELAAGNGVAGRVRVMGRCDNSNLNEVLTRSGKTLLIVDVEGFEDQLLNPENVPALRQTFILVECHDCYVAGVGQRLVNRFQDSHLIRRISWSGRSLENLEVVHPLLKWYAKHSTIGWMNERAFPTDWLWLTPLASLVPAPDQSKNAIAYNKGKM